MGDESWVFEYDPSTKRLAMQWKRNDKPQHKKARMAQSQQKLMLILFFDVQSVVMKEWVPYQKNVDTAFYSETLRKLRICVRKNRSGVVGREPVCAPPWQCPQPPSRFNAKVLGEG